MLVNVDSSSTCRHLSIDGSSSIYQKWWTWAGLLTGCLMHQYFNPLKSSIRKLNWALHMQGILLTRHCQPKMISKLLPIEWDKDYNSNDKACRQYRNKEKKTHKTMTLKVHFSKFRKYRLSQKEQVHPNLLPFPYKSSYILEIFRTWLSSYGTTYIEVLCLYLQWLSI